MVPRGAFERTRSVRNTSAFVIMRSTKHDFHKTPGPRTPEVARFRNRIDCGSLWTFGIRGTF